MGGESSSKGWCLLMGIAFAIPFGVVLCFALLYVAGVNQIAQAEPPALQTQAYEWMMGVPQNSDADFQYTDPNYSTNNVINGSGIAQPGEIAVNYSNVKWSGYTDGNAGGVSGTPIGDYGKNVPVGCAFGYNPDYTMLGVGVPHNGVDWTVGEGSKVVAVMGGQVVWAGINDGWGRLVVVENGDYQIWYAHLLEIFVTQGQIVQQGDLLAFSGGKTPPAGNSTGPHLHEGIMHKDANGNYFWLNPENFVDPSLFVEVGC